MKPPEETRVFLLTTQGDRLFSWFPKSKDAGNLAFQLPQKNDKEPFSSVEFPLPLPFAQT